MKSVEMEKIKSSKLHTIPLPLIMKHDARKDTFVICQFRSVLFYLNIFSN